MTIKKAVAACWLMTCVAHAATNPANNRTWSDFVETNFPFFSSVLDARKLGNGFPTNNLTPRGLILNLGQDCWACFDTDLLRISAVWSGSGVTPASMSQGSYHTSGVKAQEGQEKLPQIAGTAWLANGIYPGWQAADRIALTDPREPAPDVKEVGRGPLPASQGRFNAVRLVGDGVQLEYAVESARITERIRARTINGQRIVQRHVHIDGLQQSLWLALGWPAKGSNLHTIIGYRGDADKPVVSNFDSPEGVLGVRVRPTGQPIDFYVAFNPTPSPRTWSGATSSKGGRRWPETNSTSGVESTAQAAYVVDDIALP